MTTDRLTLVPVGPEHVEDLVVLHAGADVAYWYAGVWTCSEAQAWAEQMEQRWQHEGVGKWMAYRRSDGELVGRGGLTRTRIGGEPGLELGWLVREQHRGLGFATEIGRAGLTYAFDALGADEVVAFTEVHNQASRAVMVRLGMVDAGVIYRPGLVEGQVGVQPSAPFALHRTRRTDFITSPAGPVASTPGRRRGPSRRQGMAEIRPAQRSGLNDPLSRPVVVGSWRGCGRDSSAGGRDPVLLYRVRRQVS